MSQFAVHIHNPGPLEECMRLHCTSREPMIRNQNSFTLTIGDAEISVFGLGYTTAHALITLARMTPEERAAILPAMIDMLGKSNA